MERVAAHLRARSRHVQIKRSARSRTPTRPYKLINKTAAFYWNVKAGILVFFAGTPQNMYARGLHVNGGGGRRGDEEGGGGSRRIGLCSRIRLSAPVVRSPAPPSRDTPRSPLHLPVLRLDLPGFYTRLAPRRNHHHHHHLFTPPSSFPPIGEGGRRWRKSDDQSTHFRSKPCRFRKFAAFRGTSRSWPCGKDGGGGEESEHKRARSRF